MPQTQKIVRAGSTDTVVSGANLQSLVNNALVLSDAFDNTQASAGDGYLYAQFEAYLDFVGTTGASTFDLWFIPAADGTNYADGSASVTPGRAPDVSFAVRAVTGAHQQRLVGVGRGGVSRAELPPGLFKVLARNTGTGSNLANNTNSVIRMRRWTPQGVSS